MAFERVDTQSPSEALEVLFSQAVPSLPVISMEDISRICRNDLTYDVMGGQRHVAGTADHLRPIVVWNLDAAPRQLNSGQRVIGYQVTVQPQLQFAALSIVVGDAQGSPGYMFGARVWRTADQLFVQGWEGFRTSPPGSPTPQPAGSLVAAAPVQAGTPSAPAPDSRAPDRLMAALRSESWETRAAAAELMGERRDPQAVEALIPLLKDKKEDTIVKEAAAGALRTLGDARGIASVNEWENSGRPIYMDFGPDDPAAKRRRDLAAEARAQVNKARRALDRALREQEELSPASQDKERPTQRPWWRFWR
ncbi:MAG TPA: HEAT repeat domain-containing protein [Dehalococcoidia bacterium]|nr:HEAT repeat domain-containing protein [Dehalococcoidia bacterium]